MTSHDVVARVRRLAGTRKVGHAGTLDPMATGVLVLGVNRATRLLGHLMLTEKAYDATIRLGVATTTDDAEGEVVATAARPPRHRRGDPHAPLARVRRRHRAGADRGVGDQGRRQARLRSGSATARRSSCRPGRSPSTSWRCTTSRAAGDVRRRRRLRALLQRHLHPGHRPRPRRRARRRRAPHRAAAYRRRAVRPRRRPHPRASSPSDFAVRADRRGRAAPASRPSTSTTTQAADVRVGRALDARPGRAGRRRCSPRTASSSRSTSSAGRRAAVAVFAVVRRAPIWPVRARSGRPCGRLRPCRSGDRVDDVPADLGRTVVTIGNFDGVHLGHQHVLAPGPRGRRPSAASTASSR